MKKVLKRTLIMILLLVLGLTIGYFIFGWNTISGSELSSESFLNTFYVSLDEKTYLSFGSMKQITLLREKEIYFFDTYVYSDSIFEVKSSIDNKPYYFSVIDEETIYCYDFNTYVYKVVTENGK
ncbi:MAG: hypothetical protein MJ222_01975 [Bacilli bacterium]|nr:hypothetical protein [Bacilli bacterium]